MSDLLDKISELEQQLVELKAEAKKEKEKDRQDKRWRGNRYENYWYVTDCGIAITEEDIRTANSATDNYRYDTHNYFQTEEEARKYASVLETERQLRKFADVHNDVIDWKNAKQDKWYLYYSYHMDKIITSHVGSVSVKIPRVVYFTSETVLRLTVDIIGEDKIKKYLTYEW